MRKGILLVGAFLLYSCISEIEIDGFEPKPYLVVNSLFCAGSEIRVHVSSSVGFNSPTPPNIIDANIELYKNEILIGKLDYAEDGWYESEYVVSEGNTYRIEVYHSNYGMVRAESYVPRRITIDSAYYYFRAKWSVNHQFYLAEISIEFIDTDSMRRFYEVIFEQVGVYFNVDYMTDPSVLKEGDWDFEPSTLYFSNDLFAGQKKVLKVDYSYNPTYDYFTGEFLPDRNMFVKLRTVSEEFFLARRSWTKHKYNQQNSYNAGDGYNLPFIGEPQQMYTNVQGGYGVFAGYTEYEIKVYYIEE